MAAKAIIDETLPDGAGKTFWRVYYWAERPDADKHVDDDKEHWAPDSEHETKGAAEARAKAIKAGTSPNKTFKPAPGRK